MMSLEKGILKEPANIDSPKISSEADANPASKLPKSINKPLLPNLASSYQKQPESKSFRPKHKFHLANPPHAPKAAKLKPPLNTLNIPLQPPQYPFSIQKNHQPPPLSMLQPPMDFSFLQNISPDLKASIRKVAQPPPPSLSIQRLTSVNNISSDPIPTQGPQPLLSWSNIYDANQGNADLVASLYDLTMSHCEQCGFRFRDKTKMGPHLDWHFRQNLREVEKTKKAFSRPWYLPRDIWDQSDTKPVEVTLDIEPEEKVEISVVVAREDQTVCPSCNEKFKQFFDPEADEWYYEDTFICQETNIVYHTDCRASNNDGFKLEKTLKRSAETEIQEDHVKRMKTEDS